MESPLPRIELARAFRARTIDEPALVLAARDIPHEVSRDGLYWVLSVEAEYADAATLELSAYHRENRPVTPSAMAPPVDPGWRGVCGFLAIIWGIPLLAGYFDITPQTLREAGILHALAVQDGAWWRTVTALTLHADLAHIVSNSAFGVVFGLMAARNLGSGFAWLVVLLSAACGNLLNASLRWDDFRSLGASTATFAAVGVVAATSWLQTRTGLQGLKRWSADWRRTAAPVFAGVALVAFTGTGGGDDNVDVLAHVSGFICGFASGALVSRIPREQLTSRLQTWSASISLGLLALCWILALRNA